MAHEKLKQDALDAIDKLHSDTSVSPETTLDSLEEVMEHLEMSIDALKLTMHEEPI